MPTVGRHDRFESEYRAQLDAKLQPYGLRVDYPLDRAALDLGLHLYRELEGDVPLSQVRVWFQCKGIERDTLSAEAIRASAEVAVRDLPIEHVQFWYGAPEPVYLCVYLEATDEFILEDVRDIVDRMGGMAELARRRNVGQQTMTLKVSSDASLSKALAAMPRHRSLRIDGPRFRGRPLGHNYDPLRSELKQLAPDDFASIVEGLLDAHEFVLERAVALGEAFGSEVGAVSATVGTLHLTYEWVEPKETQFGFDADSQFRTEGASRHVQGKVLVVVHSDVVSKPVANERSRAIVESLEGEDVKRALVFINTREGDIAAWSGWRFALDPWRTDPQALGSLAFNVLTTTCVYLDYLEHIELRVSNYLV
jgi:hypothetical protein